MNAILGEHLKPEAFLETELREATKDLDGPVKSFTVERTLRTQLSERAVETGVIDAADFAKCPAFEDPEEPHHPAALAEAIRRQKMQRFEAKRLVEVLYILNRAQYEDDNHGREGDRETKKMLRLRGQVAEEYAEGKLWEATLVEGARRAHLALHDPEYANANDMQRSRNMIEMAIEHLYDKPDPKIVNHCRSLVQVRLQQAEQSKGEAGEFARRFREQYGHALEIRGQIAEAVLDEKRASELHNLLHDKFDTPFENVREAMGNEISNTTIPKAVNLLLQQLGYQQLSEASGEATGWKARPDKNAQGFRVDEGPQELVCGRRRKEITWEIFERLLVHELFHLARSANGKKSEFAPLGYGLARNVDVEEGNCMIWEMAWQGKKGVVGLGRDHYRYLTSSYALGTMDGRKHSPQETFDFVSQLMTVDKIASSPDQLADKYALCSALKESRGAEFEHEFRASRGMPEGIVFPKDLAYLGGKINMINYINRSPLATPQLYDYLASGKFNPLIANQADLAYKLWQQQK